MKTFAEWLHQEGYFTPQELKAKGEDVAKEREAYQELYEEEYFRYLVEEIKWTPFRDIVVDRWKTRIPLIIRARRVA